MNMAVTRERNFTTTAHQKRTQLADYFMGEGEVEWQYRMVNLQIAAEVSAHGD